MCTLNKLYTLSKGLFSITKLPEGSWAKMSVLLLLAFLCSRWVCSSRFPNPPRGFCFTLQSLCATLSWRGAEDKGLGRCQAGTPQKGQQWDGGCVWHTDWLQAVSDTCHSVTSTPFLAPTSHYLKGYYRQDHYLVVSAAVWFLCSVPARFFL